MKLAILTTETTHHLFFIKEVQKFAEICFIGIETKCKNAPFETFHNFELERDSFEKDFLLEGEFDLISSLEFPYSYHENCNNPELIKLLLRSDPDFIFVYGTGKLLAKLIHEFKGKILNFHGADPSEYRGLDSNLWAIYHSDFRSLKVSLHQVNEQLDGGDIFQVNDIKITPNLKLHQLRSQNVIECVNLAKSFINSNDIKYYPQNKIGRYYSFMPSCLKEVCLNKFNSYTKSLV